MNRTHPQRQRRSGRRDHQVTARGERQDQRPKRIATALTAAALEQARLETAAATQHTEHADPVVRKEDGHA